MKGGLAERPQSHTKGTDIRYQKVPQRGTGTIYGFIPWGLIYILIVQSTLSHMTTREYNLKQINEKPLARLQALVT